MGSLRFGGGRGRSRPAWRLAAAICCAVLFSAAPARGQTSLFDEALEPAPPELARNAAFWYERALRRLGRVPPESMRILLAYEWWKEPPVTTDVQEALEEVRPILNLVSRGARQRTSDFGLDVASGPAMRLPHLTGMRTLVTLMTVDAAVALQQDRPRDAAEAIAATFRMADHLSHDDVMLSSMIGEDLFDLGEEVLRFGLDRASFRADEAAVMHLAIQQLDSEDPFRYNTALRNHKNLFTEWALERYAEEENGLDLARAELQEMAFGSLSTIELAVLSRAELEARLVEADVVLERMVEAMELRDSEQARHELQQLDRAVGRGEHGLLAQVLLYPTETILDRRIRAVERVAAHRATLLTLAERRASPLSYANAAVWYRRAASHVMALAPEERRAIREIVRETSQTMPADIRDRLESSPEIVEIALEGSLLERCAFATLEDSPPALLTWDQYGAKHVAWLVFADARRLIEDRDTTGAMDRLGIVLRMSRHIADDQRLVSAIMAHELFDQVWQLAKQGIERGLLNEASCRRLLREVYAFSPRDPFGYERAMEAERERLEPWLLGMLPVDDDRLPAILERVLTRTNGRIVAGMLVMMTPELEPLEQTINPLTDDAAAVFESVLDREAVEAWFAAIHDWRASASMGRVEEMFAPRGPDIVTWERGQRDARQLWRDAMLRLREAIEDGQE